MTTLPALTYGQVRQFGLLHLNMPLQDLFGLEWAGATLALIRISPIVLGLLKAMSGGEGKTSFMKGSRDLLLSCVC